MCLLPDVGVQFSLQVRVKVITQHGVVTMDLSYTHTHTQVSIVGIVIIDAFNTT